MARGKKQGKSRAPRRSTEAVQELFGQLEAMVKGGEPLMKSLDKLGISYSNYNYWKKKFGKKISGGRGRRGRPAAAAGSAGKGVMGVLDAMKQNRAQRADLEKSIRALDSQFNQLKAKLGRG